MSYAPYPAYKDSGVPWLGKIPEHWKTPKIQHVVRLRSGEAITVSDITDSAEYVVYGGNGPRGFTDAYTHDGDFALVGRQGALCGNVHYASGKFWASEHALVANPSRPFEVKWFGEVLRAMDLNQYSVSAAQPGLSVDNVARLAIPFPPLEEQTAIADFLDKKTAEIDDLISKKEELLRLLAEQRTALITHAVTKGLNPNAPMKPSGINWLGDVPEGWDIRPISTAIQKLESGVSVNAMDVPAEDDQQGVLKTSAVYSGSFDPTQNKLIYDPVEAERLACPVRKGELIISRMNTPDLVGAVGIVEDEHPNLFLPDRLWQTRFWNQATANAPFLYYFLNSKLFRAMIASLASGTSGSMQNITQSDLMKIKIGMPPLSEQDQIVDFLDQALEKLDATRDKTEEAIKKLKEYRTALITNAVTGKIKVA